MVNCSSDKAKDLKTFDTDDSVQKAGSLGTQSATTQKKIFKSNPVVLSPSKNEEDLPINDYLTKELQPIRNNFKELNSTTEWTGVDKRKLENMPENGRADYYFLGKSLKKIIAYFPSTKSMAEFYVLNGQLSMAVFKYIESQDDYEELVEDKSYFKNSKLIHIISSQDCGAPYDDKYLREEGAKILSLYERIKNRLNH